MVKMIYTLKSDTFQAKFDIAFCVCHYNGQVLLLQRLPNKPQGNQWGVPAGKLNTDEDPLTAVQRELNEETGIFINPTKFKFKGKLYDSIANLEFGVYLYLVEFTEQPEVKISKLEHQQYVWVDLNNMIDCDLIEDAEECIRTALS